MIDGYSVQEAASVLGVPEGRVWELLARGVLSGTPEGDSMRVFLKTQPGPIATAGASPRDEPRTNGNGGNGGHGAEASPFRELLTEFRNLTERYGQALLALGESRGEVAGLRSRVELLEARLDLRLPPARDAEPVAWESAAAPIPVAAQPTAPGALDEAAAEAPPRAGRQRKGRAKPSATASFAEALARAEDPTVAEVSAPRRAASPAPEQPASIEPEPAVEVRLAELPSEALPESLPPVVAEAAAGAPLAEPATDEATAAEAAPASPYTPEVVEPDWFADGDFAWLDVAEMEAREVTAAAAATVEAPATEARPPVKAEAEPAGEPVADPAFEAVHWEPEPPAPEPVPAFVLEAPVEAEPEVAAAQPVAAFEIEPQPEATTSVDAAPAADLSLQPRDPELAPEPDAGARLHAVPMVEPPTGPRPEPWDGPAESPPGTTAADEEELMWLGERQVATAIAAPEVEVAAPRRRSATQPVVQPVAAPDPLDAAAWPAVDRGRGEAPRTVAMSDDQLARLAREEGWDEAEVAAIRAMIAPSPAPQANIQLPGAGELDEAMAAFDRAAPGARPAPSNAWAKPPTDRNDTRIHEEWAYEAEPPAPRAARPSTSPSPQPPLRRPAADPEWLRTRRGPAATAYRRLRRLFSG